MKFFLRFIFYFSVLAFIFLVAIFAINKKITTYSQQYIFTDIENLPETEVALVLGASVFVNGRLSDVLHDRAMTAVELYRAGKVKKILVSGDHGKDEYDEVNAVKKFLLQENIPSNKIFLDHAGFDTYDSMYRARDIYKVESMVVTTQGYHLPRAIYLGRNLDMNVYGFESDKRSYVKIEYFVLRERLARIKAYFDIAFNSKPKFLGEEIPISGEAEKSWDE